MNCGATSKLAICRPIFVTKAYALVAKKMSLIRFLVVKKVDTTIEYLWQFGHHNYHYKSKNYMVTRDIILVTKALPLYNFCVNICSHNMIFCEN